MCCFIVLENINSRTLKYIKYTHTYIFSCFRCSFVLVYSRLGNIQHHTVDNGSFALVDFDQYIGIFTSTFNLMHRHTISHKTWWLKRRCYWPYSKSNTSFQCAQKQKSKKELQTHTIALFSIHITQFIAIDQRDANNKHECREN